jgi:hypothetical protein
MDKKAWLLILGVTILILTVPSSLPFAAELDKPTEKVVTIPQSRYESLIKTEKQLGNIEASEIYWNSLAWAVGFIYVLITVTAIVVGFLGPKLLKYYIRTELDERIGNLSEGLNDRFQQFTNSASKTLNGALSRIYNSIALSNFHQLEYSEAIRNIERAITYADKLEQVEDPGAEHLAMHLKGNRCYYLACVGREEDRHVALSDCEGLLHLLEETGDITYIDSYIFVMMIYGRTPEQKREWKRLYQEYKDPISQILAEITPLKHLIGEYEKYYEELKGQT